MEDIKLRSQMNQQRITCPPYDHPPMWIPKEQRINHDDYRTDVHNFLARKVYLQRPSTMDSLGFNIRGGREHFCGIFLSKVSANSEADRIGLREGDQILSVNGHDFLNIGHGEAVHILKSSSQINMEVRYFPYGYRNTYDVETSDKYAPKS